MPTRSPTASPRSPRSRPPADPARPIAAESSATARWYGSGAGLLARRIFGGDDGGKVARQVGAVEHAADFHAERAGGDRRSAPPAAARRIASAAPGNSTESSCSSASMRAALSAVEAVAARSTDKDRARSVAIAWNAASIVVAEIPRRSSRARDRSMPRRRQHVAKGAEMQRLAVGDDAVEVEDDRAQHLLLHPLAGADRNLAADSPRGGYGHS